MELQELELLLPGVIARPVKRFSDSRGWLSELYRDDELPDGFDPTMGYISMTYPGVARGPHEHREQSDGFVFLFADFEITLWENRPGRAKAKAVVHGGKENPLFLVVPPGVVHAYRNVSSEEGLVLNFPDKLYAGWEKKEPVDEIRHEENDSEFKL